MPSFIFVPILDEPSSWPTSAEAARNLVKNAVSAGIAHTVTTRNPIDVNLASLRAADAIYCKCGAGGLESGWPTCFLAVDDQGTFWQVAVDLEIEPSFFTHREAEKLFQKGA